MVYSKTGKYSTYTTPSKNGAGAGPEDISTHALPIYYYYYYLLFGIIIMMKNEDVTNQMLSPTILTTLRPDFMYKKTDLQLTGI